ncbi:MAG: hypothetical protein NTX12_08540 [Actinobacteria bacterium]|nr:hypothetical protein [Actinomycetota bacterium]
MRENFPSLGLLNDGYQAKALTLSAIRLGITVDIYRGKLRDSEELDNFVQSSDLVTQIGDEVPISLLRNLQAKGNLVRPSPELRSFGKPKESNVQILVARSPHGQASTWRPMDVIQHGQGIVLSTNAGNSEYVQNIALSYAKEIQLIGVALFGMNTAGTAPSIDSMVIGPTLWGEWSSVGARTSQYEQHLRALFDLPLGDTQTLSRNVVTGFFAGKAGANLYRPYLHLMARNPDLKFEQYGSELESFRGQVTAHGKVLLDLNSTIEHALDFMNGVIDE